MRGQQFDPVYNGKAYQCPHCGVYARQTWTEFIPSAGENYRVSRGRCEHCHEPTLWYGGKLVYPSGLIGPVAAEGMSDAVREVYEEARAVTAASPRAAAALLRVCVEMLVNELVPGKDKLNTKIGQLVKDGLDPRIQKMLDSVRWYGNDGGAHPGEIDLKEQSEVVPMLMLCVNRIVEQMVTWPRQIDAFYETIPENKRQGIENRDLRSAKQSPGQS